MAEIRRIASCGNSGAGRSLALGSVGGWLTAVVYRNARQGVSGLLGVDGARLLRLIRGMESRLDALAPMRQQLVVGVVGREGSGFCYGPAVPARHNPRLLVRAHARVVKPSNEQ